MKEICPQLRWYDIVITRKIFCQLIHLTDIQVWECLKFWELSLIGGVATRLVNLPLTADNNLMGFFFFQSLSEKLNMTLSHSLIINEQSAHKKRSLIFLKVWEGWGLGTKSVCCVTRIKDISRTLVDDPSWWQRLTLSSPHLSEFSARHCQTDIVRPRTLPLTCPT